MSRHAHANVTRVAELRGRKSHTRVVLDGSNQYGAPQMLVLFYEDESVFSNFHAADFKASSVEDKEMVISFCCSEQYFMYRKAKLVGDERIAAAILSATDPMTMKMLGRKLAMSKEMLKLWSSKSRDAMYRGCLEKFSQNRHHRLFLFRTHGMRLVEASANDAIWGIGLDKFDKRAENVATWLGTNWLGECLDTVREELWNDPRFGEEREQVEGESLEHRCALLINF